jgi:HEAT repeat protein
MAMGRNGVHHGIAVGLALALAACHRPPDQTAAREVAELLRDGDVRAAAAALDRARHQWPDSPALRQQQILFLLKTEQIGAAGEMMRQLPDQAALLVTALRARDPVIRGNAARLIADQPTAVPSRVLVDGLTDSYAPVRHHCARELGRRAEPSSLRPLFRLLRDPDGAVRAAAVTGLARLKNPHAAGWMLFMLGDADALVRHQVEATLLALVTESHRPLLRQKLPQLPVASRLVVVAALAKLNDADALALLRGATADESAAIRARAAELIGRAPVLALVNELDRLRNDPVPEVRTQADRSWEMIHTNPPRQP